MKSTINNIYKEAKALNLEIDNHNSDLYIKQSAESKKLVDSYEHKNSVKTFRSETDKGLWYEVPFAFDPFYKGVNL